MTPSGTMHKKAKNITLSKKVVAGVPSPSFDAPENKNGTFRKLLNMNEQFDV